MRAPAAKTRLRRRIRLAQLELLAAMNEAPTMSAAARAAQLSQPAASKLLRTLADSLSIRLFERDGRALAPTSAGRELMRRAAALVADLDRVQSELEAIDRGLVGAASLGFGVAPGYVLIPKAIEHLLEAAPRITVTLREGGMDELKARLRAGQLDLVVGRFNAGGIDRDLVTEPLYEPPMTIICGPRHPLARQRALKWQDVLDRPWILPEAGTPMRSGIEAIFRRERRRPDECLVESSSIQANIGLLSARDLLWVLSADIARYFETLGLVRVLNLPPMPGPSPFVLTHMRERKLSPAAQRLADCLRQAARSLITPGTPPRRRRGAKAV